MKFAHFTRDKVIYCLEREKSESARKVREKHMSRHSYGLSRKVAKASDCRQKILLTKSAEFVQYIELGAKKVIDGQRTQT